MMLRNGLLGPSDPMATEMPASRSVCCTGREPSLVGSAEGRLLALPVEVMARLCGLMHARLSGQLEGSPPLRRTRVGSVRLGRGSDRPGARLPGRRNVPRLYYVSPGVAPILGVRTWLNRKLGKERTGQLRLEFLEHAHRPRE